jgi:hypothetical protein
MNPPFDRAGFVAVQPATPLFGNAGRGLHENDMGRTKHAFKAAQNDGF